ncbi:substrate-binding periplasmic protein [Chitinimonas lacunae]|uniref:Substrate-binding periplasmic protein n=1 Tax=Chitinimonas lacunae TaxID=1963018 RepID=A0ABV8ML51_9NEIS
MRKGWWGLLLALALPVGAALTEVPVATGEWAPFVVQGSPPGGAFVEIVRATFREAGLEPRFQFLSWPLCEALVEKGQIFAAFPYIKTPERLQRFDYSASLAETQSVLFYRKSTFPQGLEIRRLIDLQPYRVGAVPGEWYVEPLLRAEVAVDYSSTYEQAVAKLLAGRLDFLPMNELRGWYYIHQRHAEQADLIATLPNPLGDQLRGNHLIVSRRYPESDSLRRRLDAALERLKRSGAIERILTDYGLLPKGGRRKPVQPAIVPGPLRAD